MFTTANFLQVFSIPLERDDSVILKTYTNSTKIKYEKAQVPCKVHKRKTYLENILKVIHTLMRPLTSKQSEDDFFYDEIRSCYSYFLLK